MKVGILKQDTYIHTLMFTLKVKRGTKVFVSPNPHVLTFDGLEGVKVVKDGNSYYLIMYDTPLLILFPDGGKPYFPLVLL